VLQVFLARFLDSGAVGATARTGDVEDSTTVDFGWRTRIQGGKLILVGTFHQRSESNGQVTVQNSRGGFSGKLR
jgi:hypothetical protein